MAYMSLLIQQNNANLILASKIVLKLVKSIDILGFENKTSMKEGLTEMWEWAKSQPKRDRFIWPEYELEKGIYSFWKNK